MPLSVGDTFSPYCFRSSACLLAHTAAYNRARILHRDVSAGNILITDKGGGILIDWDLSKKVKESLEPKPRLHSRTGTWQFISVARLLDPCSAPHQVSDDLESFFWVLLYQIVRYRDTLKLGRKESVADVFDQYESKKVGLSRGGKGKLAVLGGTEMSTPFILSLVDTPCSSIIEELRILFRDFYQFITYDALAPRIAKHYAERRERDPLVCAARDKLRFSDDFLAIINEHLESEWGVDDDGSLDLSEPLLDASASRNRRKRAARDSFDGEQNFHVRRKGLKPPKSQERSRNELSSQTSSNHDRLFSVASPIHSSSGGAHPSGSLEPSHDGSSMKR